MDELDVDLVGTIPKRNILSSNEESVKFNLQSNTGIKKTVVFHEFNEDDPLADLLSDDEDFDANPKPFSIQTKGSLVSDLFGIKSSDSLKNETAQITSQLKTSSVIDNASETADKFFDRSEEWIEQPNTRTNKILEEPRKSRASQQANNIVNNYKIGPRSTSKAKKSSLMEDLFGPRPKSSTQKDKVISKDPVIPGFEMTEVQKRSELLSKSNPTGYAPTVSAPRESRRGRRSSGSITDPLGMFSSINLTTEVSRPQNFEINSSKGDQFSSSKVQDGSMGVDELGKSLEPQTEDLPEWLGGPRRFNEGANSQSNKYLPRDLPEDHKSTNLPQEMQKKAENPECRIDYPEKLAALTGNQFDQQATLMSLQQQEHELRTAATLSRQNEQLNEIIESQRNKLSNQEKQFNVLIKRQIDRQELLEAQMKAQQDRINSHLQVLLAQPTSVPMTSIMDAKDMSQGTGENNSKLSEWGSILKKLEDEKISFENIMDRLKDQHIKEIGIIEESYTRQLEMMSQGMERLEKRLRQDVELAEADYEAKVQKLKEELETLKIAHGEEIENLKKEHDKRLEEIHNQQHRNIDLIRKEYIETIENISKAKDIERQTINSATSQTKSLSETLEMMKITITDIAELKIKLENNNTENYRDKEIMLKQQIEELKDLREHLKKQHEGIEGDRKELTEATRRLDSGTLKLISEFDRQVRENTETENRLKRREETLLKEKESLDAKIQWERDHIQAMKDTWMREQERQAKQLSEERNTLAAERARLETIQRLKLDDNDMARTELEAALGTAKDASNLAVRERQKWRERLNELEVEKQKIKAIENSLTLRARELEDLTQSALEKREEGLRALKEARYLEEQHKAYLSELQKRSEVLAQRENKLAAEQLALARERLTMRMVHIEKPEKDTNKPNESVNHIGVENVHHHLQSNNDLPDSQISTTHFKEIVDPRLILLKLDLDNELDLTNDCLGTIQSIVQ